MSVPCLVAGLVPGDELGRRCTVQTCGHAMLVHDQEIGCIICDYKANIRDRVAHTVGVLRLIDERDVKPDGRDLP